LFLSLLRSKEEGEVSKAARTVGEKTYKVCDKIGKWVVRHIE
jgi:hypothetical protein